MSGRSGARRFELETHPAGVVVLLDGPSALCQRIVVSGRKTTPETDLLFRLAEDPGGGVLHYQSRSWGFSSSLGRSRVREALEAADGALMGVLKLDPVSFVARRGPMAGNLVAYMEPKLTLIDAGEGRLAPSGGEG
ncbi:hypothetical protein [Microbacterium plantarum]|uniref:Uncharacterized protein n=1 Tax=Microbacterium plantarum TaxID=1816425 RepID=A0ABV5ESU6_9MICO